MSLCLLCLPDTCLTSHSESNRRTPAAGRRHGGPDIAVEGEWIRNDQMLWRFHNVWIKLLERRELRSQVAFHHRADRNQSDWPSWSFSDWLLKWQNEVFNISEWFHSETKSSFWTCYLDLINLSCDDSSTLNSAPKPERCEEFHSFMCWHAGRTDAFLCIYIKLFVCVTLDDEMFDRFLPWSFELQMKTIISA